ASGEAKRARQRAEEATIEADAQRLLAEARRRPDELGVLLALQAYKTTAANGVTAKDMRPQVAEALQEILGTAHFSHALSVPYMEGARVVAFSPDGRWLAVVVRARQSQDQRVHLWDMRSPQSSPIILSHEGVRTLAFSPKGRFLASASSVTQEVCLW